MSNDRNKMDSSLRSIVLPFLEDLGFTGSFPHLRRPGDKGIDLITFQFDKWGGGFVIEISHCPIEGISDSLGEKKPSNKVEVWDMPFESRLRIKPRKGSGTSSWFRYDRMNLFGNLYDKVALKALVMLKKEALPYWNINE